MTRLSLRLLALGVLAALFLGGPALVTLYTDWLWFGEVGYQSVFTTVFESQGTLFTLAFVISVAWLEVNFRAALTTCSRTTNA